MLEIYGVLIKSPNMIQNLADTHLSLQSSQVVVEEQGDDYG